jgi:hypothetical protein
MIIDGLQIPFVQGLNLINGRFCPKEQKSNDRTATSRYLLGFKSAGR